LVVDDLEVASKTVTLQPGQGTREVRFEYLFNSVHVEPGRPAFVPVTAKIASDVLPTDDQRHLVAHVVAALPVVFVDQYSDERENPRESRIGETKSLRRLLAPVTSRGDRARQLIKVRHLTMNDLSRDVLADARLVVIAGVADPRSNLPLLRQYVEQGGQLIIAAGAEFDPEVWNRADEEPDANVLPAPLLPQPIGELPETARGQLKPLFLAFESLKSHDYFTLVDTSEEELRDLYSLPMFFRFIGIDTSSEAVERIRKAERERLSQQLEVSSMLNTAESDGQAEVEQQRIDRLLPDWLLWDNGVSDDSLAVDSAEEDRETVLDRQIESTRPRVLARFENEQGSPYLVERRIGQGNVLFVASGLSSSWNTLHTTDTMLIFDRILRSMIQTTLPERNFMTDQRIALPLETTDREVTLALTRPGSEGSPESLDTGYIAKDVRGFTLGNTIDRGFYRVVELDATADSSSDEKVLTEFPLAVNGPVSESELTRLSREQFDDRTAGSSLRRIATAEEISLQGVSSRGQDFYWMIFVVAVLIFLLAELVILAWPSVKVRETA